jgi:hypothetical protein
MEDGIEQHMSMLIQMQEEKIEKVAEKVAKVAKAEKKQKTLIEEQIHPIGLTLVRPLISTNSG